MNRLPIVVFCLLLLGCGSEPPHSLYFVVTFQPGTPELSETGKIALDNAVRQVREDRPSLVEIAAVVPAANAAPPGLVQERADIVSRAVRSTGLKESAVRVELRPAADKDYTPRKDSLLIRVGYGVKPET